MISLKIYPHYALAIYNQTLLQHYNLAKAYFTPYGVGLGHASRLIMVASRLQRTGVVIRFSSFGEASTIFRCKDMTV